MAILPLKRKKIIKKRRKRFIRTNADEFITMKYTWRKPHGIDNPARRRFRGSKKCVKIGYRTDKKTRDVMPNGFKKFLIKCPAELEILLMNNRVFCGEIAGNLSSRKKALIVKRAAELNVRLTNSKGKLKTEEKKPENV